MKLCSLGLIFILWGCGAASLLDAPNGTPAPRRLSLTDAQILRDTLEKAVEKYHWKAEVVSESKVQVKAKLDQKFEKFFEAEVTPAPEKNGQKAFYLVLSNVPKTRGDLSMARFHANKFYFRQTLSEDDAINDAFIQQSVDKLKQNFKALLDQQFATMMFAEFKNLVVKEAVQNIVLIERGNTGRAVIFDLNSKKSGKLIAQGIIYKIDDSRVGLSLSHFDDYTSFVIPFRNLASSNSDIVRVITDMTAKAELKLDSKSIAEMVKVKVRAICAKSVPAINVLRQTGDSVFMRIEMSGQTLTAKKDEQCPLLDSDIFVSHFTHGYMQYVHLMFNSKFLREEYVASSVASKLDANLEKAFRMIKLDTESAYKGVGGATQEIEVKEQDIKKTLEESIGEAGVNDPFTDAEIQECNSLGLKCVAKLNFPSKGTSAKIVVASSGWVITVSRSSAKSNPPADMSFSIPLKNSFDSKPGIVQHVKEIMAGL